MPEVKKSTSFHELYKELLRKQMKNEDIREADYDPHQLDCLLNPDQYAPVIHTESCESCAYDRACKNSCIFDAIEEADGKLSIDPDKCSGCGVCIESCSLDKLAESKDIFPVLKEVRSEEKDVYALIAPAFVGQYENASPGQLRSALKAAGFKGMVEVAVFADILTLKEALEFDKHINSNDDFQLTSCCCPVWIAMIRKIYHELIPHVPGAVSPMIAAGRAVKHIHHDAVTVFIGPCIAKKKEAREPDIADAVDYVLTFQEVQDIFDAAMIRPEELADNDREHSSRAGRIYAHTGGVSEAVKSTVEKLSPGREVPVRAQQADGVPACKAMIEQIKNGKTDANFFEGMACRGGCVGGPKIIIDKDKGKRNVETYGKEAPYKTPLDNPYVMELLHRLGFKDMEEFVEKSDMFTRDFANS